MLQGDKRENLTPIDGRGGYHDWVGTAIVASGEAGVSFPPKFLETVCIQYQGRVLLRSDELAGVGPGEKNRSKE